MSNSLLAKVFGTKNEREVKRLRPAVAEINALEPEMMALSDEQLREKTAEFKREVAGAVEGLEGEERERTEREALERLLAPAFAVVREAGRRSLNMRHFDVQLIGGVVLHQGKIAEMKTGEGKTLVATLPVYLNALLGKGVHVVTVNDYLAKRDAEWMGKIYKFLGLSVGVIVHDLNDEERKEAYGADVTYGTNNEYGFDYLRDNMKFRLEDCVQRGHHFAIVDEVDSILIDEARTPLIISGPSEESTDKYYRVDRIIPRLQKGEEIKKGGGEPSIFTGDYTVDEKHRTITVTEQGWEKIEKQLGIGNVTDPENWGWKHHVETAIKAHVLYLRDRDYVVKPKEDSRQQMEVVIVDEFTGRMMPGRRWSDGLHQAVEAKENVRIERENQTLATITFQNYFRMYKKLAGMTGTAETEAAEFDKTYKQEVLVIPTNQTLIRHEFADIVYRTEREKFNAVVEEIRELCQKGQPVLVGTISIDKSERLSAQLKKSGNIPHVVLNAKFHEKEAVIVAQAGRKGAVTVATNMAGRGTDILLGGNPEFMTKELCLKERLAELIKSEEPVFGFDDPHFVYFQHQDHSYRVPRPKWEEAFGKFKAQTDAEHDRVVELGGLHILGTERHEARRIDNQLRGRAGRQGDPGSSRFYLSLQDDLLRIFAGERLSGIMQRLGMEEGVPIESRLITRRIEAAQKAVEAQNFEARKHLLEYDDVMNKQREAIYGLRRSLLEGLDQRDYIQNIAAGILDAMLDSYCDKKVHPGEWDLGALANDMRGQFGIDLRAASIEGKQLNRDELRAELLRLVHQNYDGKEKLISGERLRWYERMIMLEVLDNQWKDHLLGMDHLKEGIGLRGYGQKDPLVEYKKESFTMFNEMLDRIENETVGRLWQMQVISEAEFAAIQRRAAGGEEEAPQEQPAEPAAAAPPPDGRGRRGRGSEADELVREIERRKKRELAQLQFSGGDSSIAVQTVHRGEKIGRNDPCPCGSGKKYKKCCGAG
jgi:preprotein translocase subunit SecA